MIHERICIRDIKEAWGTAMKASRRIEFVDAYPYRPLESHLPPLLGSARHLDAAVAFVTTPGVAMLRQYLKAHTSATARLVASARFPTNLIALAHLEEDYPDTVFLHTGFQTPIAGPVPGVHGGCRRPSGDYNGGKGADQ